MGRSQGPPDPATLLTVKQVDKTANAKAYEMLSNLVGLCELARATGDRSMLQAVLNAWQDVVDKRLYVTGTASQWEHFQADHELRNDTAAHVGETCVTVTWIQLNLQLLRLTGEAKFGDELERAFYNHLAAAQHPRGDDWCYYTALEGHKPYDKGITCCHSSGPRGMALVPQASYLLGHAAATEALPGHAAVTAALLVSTLETSQATLPLGGQAVSIQQHSEFPRRGSADPHVAHAAAGHVCRAGSRAGVGRPAFAHGGRPEDHGRRRLGRSAGPSVEGRRPDRRQLQSGGPADRGPIRQQGPGGAGLGPVHPGLRPEANPDCRPRPRWAWSPCSRRRPWSPTASSIPHAGGRPAEAAVKPATLVTFADAGTEGSLYRIWLRAPGVAASAASGSLLADGEETRSRTGNAHGSIVDGDPASFVVTYDTRRAKQDWFAVTLGGPATIGRVVFMHGKSFHDGGWFDAAAGKPQVQVRRTAAGPWETVGQLADYPATTAIADAGLKPGQAFTLRLPSPVSAVAVRVLGTPSCGDHPQQAFSSCGELQAFAK